MRVEEYDLCFSPPLPPTVWGELSLCFDVDFPIDTVSSILGVQPTEAKRQRACRWNAYAGTQNPGYWTITFDKTDTFDGDVVQRAMHTFIAEHERALRQVLEQFQPCTALLTIYAVVHQDGEYPSIRLNPYFLQDACRLSASVDIIVDNDYVRAEPDNGDSAVWQPEKISPPKGEEIFWCSSGDSNPNRITRFQCLSLSDNTFDNFLLRFTYRLTLLCTCCLRLSSRSV